MRTAAAAPQPAEAWGPCSLREMKPFLARPIRSLHRMLEDRDNPGSIICLTRSRRAFDTETVSHPDASSILLLDYSPYELLPD